MPLARQAIRLTAALLLLANAGTAWASCADDIAALDKRLNQEGRTAGAASGSGQATAAARGQTAVTSRDTSTPVGNLPTSTAGGSKGAMADAAQAGGGGEKVMDAKVSLNDARNADKTHDEAGCEAAVAKAKSEAGN